MMQVEENSFLDSHLLSTRRFLVETIHYEINSQSSCVDKTSGIYDFMTPFTTIDYMMCPWKLTSTRSKSFTEA
jgi:hypothetical protein